METINLNGIWQITSSKSTQTVLGKVPGSVLSAYIENKIIDDPFYRTNEYPTRDLFKQDYSFSRSFTADDSIVAQEKITLVCEGLDTLATIYINGKRLAATDNMHRTYEFDIKKYITHGENTIKIDFASPNNFIENANKHQIHDVHYVPTGGMAGQSYLRKAHCMFGWDWGPQLPDAGIWRNIYIEGYSNAKINDVLIQQKHADNNVTVNVKVDIDVIKANGLKLECSLISPDNEILSTKTVDACAYNEFSFEVKSPQLWWPNGYGSQPLYTVSVFLLNADLRQQGKELRIGLRTMTVSQDKDEWGEEFAITVNGLKMFAMGADYIPEDSVLSRVTRNTTKRLLDSCVRAHFNSIRVWGGGYYPDDFFFDLCDELGLVVWQDLMYACNVYDITEDFENSIAAETYDNVKRIRHHASLGLWCGNNEMEFGWTAWANVVTHSQKLKADYIKQFEYILPKAAKATDEATFYWPSSPSSGGCFDKPNSHDFGDVHYWDVWHQQKPFTDYRKYYFRFCSEFGFQAFPCMKTIESFTQPQDRNIFSKVMESHQKNGSANGKILYYLADNFQYPSNLDSLVYLSQILQALAIQYGVEHWRRNRGRCMGAIYWQLNDCWPVASWASIDYFGRWKALHYFAQRFFAPLTASVLDEGKHISVYVENEYPIQKSCTLSVRLKSFGFETLFEKTLHITASPLSASCAFAQDFEDLCKGREDSVFFEYCIVPDDDTQIVSDVTVFEPNKHLALCKPDLCWTVSEKEEAFIITITSNTFTRFVALDSKLFDCLFSKNYFDITSADPVEIICKKSDFFGALPASSEKFAQSLQVQQLYQTYNS